MWHVTSQRWDGSGSRRSALVGRVEQIHALRSGLHRAAEALRAMPLQARASAIAKAARQLLDEQSALGAELREALLLSTRLSLPVIEYGLHTTLKLFEPETLLALYATRSGERLPRAVVTVLAGNVFSAAARPLLFPLLCGTPVLAKAASADDVLPRYLKCALHEADPRLGDACAVTTFSRGERHLERALLEDAELVAIYGSDETIADLRPRLSAKTSIVARGHGLGAMFISRGCLTGQPAARALAARAAIDVAAYDQRGCLSPHVAIVEAGGNVDARQFAGLLAEALDAASNELPRGTVEAPDAAAELQWRGVSAALGELRRGASWAVSFEGQAPLRASPGYRNLAVYECTDLEGLRARLAPLGKHLKALGVAGASARRELTSLAPYVCPLGNMQTPPLDCPLDGLHPLHGYCS